MDIPELNVSVTKAAVNGHVVDVIDYKEYRNNLDLYLNRSDVAVPMTMDDGREILLPVKGKYSDNLSMPGLYNAGCIDFAIYPNEISVDRYTAKNMISMSNLSDIKELIKNGDAIKKLDESFIVSSDSITSIPIKDSDQPEMKGLKMALNAKQIDIDKYAPRFGDNYPNDKRQLKNSNATLKIIKRFCENCDMEAFLTFRDKSDDVPNPMGTEIVVSLTDNYFDSNEFDSNEEVSSEEEEYSDE
jgi:hypothetical protein